MLIDKEILVVEDDEKLALLIKTLLKDHNFDELNKILEKEQITPCAIQN